MGKKKKSNHVRPANPKPKSKRGKKKQLNRRTETIAASQGISAKQYRSYTEAEKAEIRKKEHRRQQQRKLYAEKRKYIDYFYLNENPRASWEKLYNAMHRRLSEQDEKRAFYEQYGIRYTERDTYKSWEQIHRDYNAETGSKKYRSEYRFYLAVYDSKGTISIKESWQHYDGYSLDELRRAMMESYYFRGDIGSDDVATEIHVNYESEGINLSAFYRMDKKHGYEVGFYREFSLKGAMKFITGILDITRIDEREHVYHTFARYLKENMYELWEKFDIRRI